MQITLDKTMHTHVATYCMCLNSKVYIYIYIYIDSVVPIKTGASVKFYSFNITHCFTD